MIDSRDVRGPLRLLWGAALVVLVIGVTKVAGLVIASSRTRLNELGTRLALAASRTDLLRQLVVEGMIIIDKRLAHRFWPGGDPIGRRMFRPENPRPLLTIDANTRWLTVVGVVGATKLRGPAAEEVTTGTFYLPYAATAPRDFGYVVRSNAGSATIIGELRSALGSLDREAPLFDVRTLAERTSLSLMSRTSTMRIAVLFAVVAVFLSSVGLYGTLSYLVAQRRREFGVRLAIGSTPRLIVGLVLREGLVLAVAGVVTGGLASLAIRSLVSTQLYGIAASDPRVLALTAVSLAAVALVASLLPAKRATRVDVMRILNAE